MPTCWGKPTRTRGAPPAGRIHANRKRTRRRKRILDHNLRKASEKRSGTGAFAGVEVENS